MFRHLTVRGQAGAVLWGCRTAAVVAAWTIVREDHEAAPPTWRLAARLTRADAFQCRQRPLLFTAPHTHGRGMWCWGIESVNLVGLELRAVLGPPEQ